MESSSGKVGEFAADSASFEGSANHDTDSSSEGSSDEEPTATTRSVSQPVSTGGKSVPQQVPKRRKGQFWLSVHEAKIRQKRLPEDFALEPILPKEIADGSLMRRAMKRKSVEAFPQPPLKKHRTPEKEARIKTIRDRLAVLNRSICTIDHMLAKHKQPTWDAMPSLNQKPAPKSSKKKVNLSKPMKYCLNLLRKLRSFPEAYSFNYPVEVLWPTILETDYFSIVGRPMDFGTIEQNLLAGKYELPDDFERDCRLVFSNSTTYNRAGEQLYDHAVMLEKEFEEGWKNLPPLFPAHTPSIGVVGQATQKIGEIERQLPKMRKEIKAAKEEPPLTYEEKENLSLKINDLEMEHIQGVVDIIRANMPDVMNGESEEIELDVERLNTKTLRALEVYVKKLDDTSQATDKNTEASKPAEKVAEDSEKPQSPTSSEDEESEPSPRSGSGAKAKSSAAAAAPAKETPTKASDGQAPAETGSRPSGAKAKETPAKASDGKAPAAETPAKAKETPVEDEDMADAAAVESAGTAKPPAAPTIPEPKADACDIDDDSSDSSDSSDAEPIPRKPLPEKKEVKVSNVDSWASLIDDNDSDDDDGDGESSPGPPGKAGPGTLPKAEDAAKDAAAEAAGRAGQQGEQPGGGSDDAAQESKTGGLDSKTSEIWSEFQNRGQRHREQEKVKREEEERLRREKEERDAQWRKEMAEQAQKGKQEAELSAQREERERLEREREAAMKELEDDADSGAIQTANTMVDLDAEFG